MQWDRVGAKRRRYGESHQLRYHSLRFRKRSELMAFALKYPGALAGQFLAQVSGRPFSTTPTR